MPDVVIVGSDGTRHVFPDGFDPQKAAGIVRASEPQSQGWASSLSSIASPEGLQGLKQYGKELLTGDGSARGAVGDYAKKEFGTAASDVAHPLLHPIDTVEGIGRAALHPIDTATNLATVGKSALEGDPTAVGHVMGAIVAPKAYGSALRGVNTAAQAVADSPKLQGTAGYIGGAGVGIAGGGHPFIMGRIGQAASPIIGSAARGVANASGSVMDAFGMERSGALPKEFDRYAPNSSGFDPRDPPVAADVSPVPRGIAQGVYTPLPDGNWGVKALPGFKLTPGEPVNVMSSAGIPTVITVGKVSADGIAALGSGSTAPMMSVGGDTLEPAVREAVMKRLAGDQ